MNLITGIFKNEDLRKRILFLMMCLMLYKIGTHITVPWVNADLLKGIATGEGALSLVNSLNGGSLANFSIFAVGIMPYITSSIIIQLMQMGVVPTLTEWGRQGEAGQKKLKKLTFALTIVIAIIQSVGISFGFNKLYPGLVSNESIVTYLLIALVLTLGTVFLVIMGHFIDKKGIGKGISIIILSGILVSLPNNLAMYYDTEFTDAGDGLFISIIKTILLVLFAYALLVSIIIVNGAERRIPIQQSSAGKLSSQKSFLPIKINASGVIPVIFASSLIMAPVTIANFYGGKVATFVNSYISYTTVTGMILYVLIIIGFTYFYTFVQMDPKVISKNLKDNLSHIPSIRPGVETEDYLRKILVRLTLVGSIFLSVIVIAPMILGNIVTLPQQIVFGGTSIVIIVSVVIDLKSQVLSSLTGSTLNVAKRPNRSIFK